MEVFAMFSSNYSIRKRLFTFSIVLLVIECVSTIAVSAYYSQILIKNTYNNFQEILINYNDQLSSHLATAESCMISYAGTDVDIETLITLNDATKTPLYQVRVKNLLSNILPYLSDVNGIFVYAPKTDSYVSRYYNASEHCCDTYISSTLRDAIANDATGDLTLDKWYFEQLDGDYYLVRIISYPYCYVGAWSKLDTLTSSFRDLTAFDSSFYYVDEFGNALNPSDEIKNSFAPVTDIGSSKIISGNDHVRYLDVSTTLSFCDYYVTALIPMEEINKSIAPVYRGIFFSTLFLLLFLTFLMLSMNRYLAKPLSFIQQISTRFKKGHYDARIDYSKEKCSEVIEISETLNSLLDEIQQLQIDIYEEKIAKSQFELQYLKSQIAPHFLINCLQTIYTLQDSKDGKILSNRMMQTLSDHLRYTLSTRNNVPLSEELHYVDNYIELTSIRFPGCLTYTCDVDPACLDASIFPILLLMLTENTIKYNLVMGEPLEISIQGYPLEKDGKTYVHLTHIDSGDGYSEEQLRIFQASKTGPIDSVDGHKIGIYNILKRMEILYHEQGSISFSNEPGMGARIDIEVLYIPYKESEKSDEYLNRG